MDFIIRAILLVEGTFEEKIGAFFQYLLYF